MSGKRYKEYLRRRARAKVVVGKEFGSRVRNDRKVMASTMAMEEWYRINPKRRGPGEFTVEEEHLRREIARYKRFVAAQKRKGRTPVSFEEWQKLPKRKAYQDLHAELIPANKCAKKAPRLSSSQMKEVHAAEVRIMGDGENIKESKKEAKALREARKQEKIEQWEKYLRMLDHEGTLAVRTPSGRFPNRYAAKHYPQVHEMFHASKKKRKDNKRRLAKTAKCPNRIVRAGQSTRVRRWNVYLNDAMGDSRAFHYKKRSGRVRTPSVKYPAAHARKHHGEVHALHKDYVKRKAAFAKRLPGIEKEQRRRHKQAGAELKRHVKEMEKRKAREERERAKKRRESEKRAKKAHQEARKREREEHKRKLSAESRERLRAEKGSEAVRIRDRHREQRRAAEAYIAHQVAKYDAKEAGRSPPRSTPSIARKMKRHYIAKYFPALHERVEDAEELAPSSNSFIVSESSSHHREEMRRAKEEMKKKTKAPVLHAEHGKKKRKRLVGPKHTTSSSHHRSSSRSSHRPLARRVRDDHEDMRSVSSDSSDESTDVNIRITRE